jgi:hypothetical protein
MGNKNYSMERIMTTKKQQEFCLDGTKQDYQTNKKLDHKTNQDYTRNTNIVCGRKITSIKRRKLKFNAQNKS